MKLQQLIIISNIPSLSLPVTGLLYTVISNASYTITIRPTGVCVCVCVHVGVLVWPCLFVVWERVWWHCYGTCCTKHCYTNLSIPIKLQHAHGSNLSCEVTWSERVTTKSAVHVDEAINSGQTEADSHANSRSSGRTSKTLIWKRIFITALQTHKSFLLDQLEFSIFISYLLLVPPHLRR